MPRPLGDSRQKDAGGRGIAERGVVVLGEMVAVKPRAIVSLDKLEPLFEMLAERQAAVVQVVKDPKLHCFPFPQLAADQVSAKAGMTSFANSSTERIASSKVISPKARSHTTQLTPPSSACSAMYSRARAGVPANPWPLRCNGSNSSGSTPCRGNGTPFCSHRSSMCRRHGR